MKTFALVATLTVGLAAGGVASAQVEAPPDAALLARVEHFDRHALPGHPRLLLNQANIAAMRAAASGVEKPAWTAVRQWLDKAAAETPIDPDALGDPKRAGFNIADFRKIQSLAEDVENHIVVPAAAYRILGNPADLALARRWALAVARWKPNGRTGIKADDYAARQCLSALALAYDGLYDQWSPAERSQLRGSITARARALLAHQRPFQLDEFNNHPWFQTAALVDAGLALGDESAEADGWWRYGAELFFTRYLTLWGRDGDWHEGMSYATFTLKYVCQFANSLTSATGINPFELPALKRAGYFRLYVAPPGTRGIDFNDTRPLAAQSWDRPIADRLAGETHDPVLQWYADQLPRVDYRPSSNLYTLLYHDPSLGDKPPTALPLTMWWHDSGWVVARTDLTTSQDVEFGFKSSPWIGTALRAKGHDHPDANNLLLNYLGEPLIADSGYYDYYSSPQHKGWTFTGRAHNTLLIDGQEQEIRRPGKVIGVQSGKGWDWIEGQGAGGYADGLVTSWRRQVLYLRPHLFVVRDLVRLPKPETVTLLLHAFQPFELNGQAFVERNGAAAASGIVAAPRDLQIRQWTGFPPGTAPERKTPSDLREFPDQSHLELTTPGKMTNVTFVTVLRASKADEATPAQARVDGDQVRTTYGSEPPVTVTFAPVPADDAPSAPPRFQ